VSYHSLGLVDLNNSVQEKSKLKNAKKKNISEELSRVIARKQLYHLRAIILLHG